MLIRYIALMMLRCSSERLANKLELFFWLYFHDTKETVGIYYFYA